MARDCTTTVQSPLTTTFTVFLQYNSHLLDDPDIQQRMSQIKWELNLIMEPILQNNNFLSYPEIISMPSSVDDQCQVFTSVLTRYIINIAILRMRNDEELLFVKQHPSAQAQQEKQYLTYQQLQEERETLLKERRERRMMTKKNSLGAPRELTKSQAKQLSKLQKQQQKREAKEMANSSGNGKCNIM